MPEPSAEQAGRLLRSAGSAEARGAAAARRPAWYPLGLGISTGLALAAFAVPAMTTAGLVLAGVILPVVLESEARRRTGASPVRDYLAAPTRATALAYVAGGVSVGAISLVALKVTGESSVVLPGALVLAVWTFLAAHRVDRLRARPGDAPDPRA